MSKHAQFVKFKWLLIGGLKGIQADQPLAILSVQTTLQSIQAGFSY